jgi:hypothetical protein
MKLVQDIIKCPAKQWCFGFYFHNSPSQLLKCMQSSSKQYAIIKTKSYAGMISINLIGIYLIIRMAIQGVKLNTVINSL